MEIHQLAVVLLLASCAHAQPADVMRRYQHFLTQHVYGNMHEGLCNREIGNRDITEGNTNNCKEVNTFIKATHDQVRAVCQDAGIPRGGGLYDSTVRFSVVTCRLQSGARRPSCMYRGQKSTRFITVACDHRYPVHYEEDRL